jgi:hypothetical protein
MTSLSHPGEENGNAILCEAQVRLIFELSKDEIYSQRELGRLFGISQSAVCDIKHRRTWCHLDYGDGRKG